LLANHKYELETQY